MKFVSILLCVAAAACGHAQAPSQLRGDSVGNSQPTEVFDPIPYVGEFDGDRVEVFVATGSDAARLTWRDQQVMLRRNGLLACAGCIGEYGNAASVPDSTVDVTLMQLPSGRLAAVHRLDLTTGGPRGDSVGNGSNPWYAGNWGARGISLHLDDSKGHYELDCAHGDLDAPFSSAGGAVTARGTYVREHGGPSRPDEPADTHPAAYWLEREAGGLRMTVALDDSDSAPTIFHLREGEGFVMKCL
jgi:hypothetical protein